LPNIKITPVKGGVGPLTVSALFENVITACRNIAPSQQNGVVLSSDKVEIET